MQTALFLFPLDLLPLDLVPTTDRNQQGLEMQQEILLRDTGLPIHQEQQLPLHEVHFRHREPKPTIPLDGGIPGPVLVLGTGVVEVLRGQDQAGQEDAMNGAAHALGDGGQTGAQTSQIDQGGHERGCLHLGASDERCNEDFDRGQWWYRGIPNIDIRAVVQGGRARGRWLLIGQHGRFTADDQRCLTSQMRDHVAVDRERHEFLEGFVHGRCCIRRCIR